MSSTMKMNGSFVDVNANWFQSLTCVFPSFMFWDLDKFFSPSNHNFIHLILKREPKIFIRNMEISPSLQPEQVESNK